MKISSAFPSTYLKAADLDGTAITVTIDRVVMEPVSRSGEPQPVVYFDGHTRGMVLNKTNAKKIMEVYGDDTDNWTRRKIILYPAMVEFQGDTVAAIRVRHVPSTTDSPAIQVRGDGYPDLRYRQAANTILTDSTHEPPISPTPGGKEASLVVEAEAITRQGVDGFRAWRDRLKEEELQLIRPHMGRLLAMAHQPDDFPKLSEAAKKTLKKKSPPEIQEDVF